MMMTTMMMLMMMYRSASSRSKLEPTRDEFNWMHQTKLSSSSNYCYISLQHNLNDGDNNFKEFFSFHPLVLTMMIMTILMMMTMILMTMTPTSWLWGLIKFKFGALTSRWVKSRLTLLIVTILHSWWGMRCWPIFLWG